MAGQGELRKVHIYVSVLRSAEGVVATLYICVFRVVSVLPDPKVEHF